MPSDLAASVHIKGGRSFTQVVAGYLSLADCQRLHAAGVPGEVAGIDCAVAAGESGERESSGLISASIELTCQRCLGAVTVALEAQPAFTLVEDFGTSSGQSEDPDTIVLRNGALDLATLTEDELLLALPLVARHDDATNCAATSQSFGDVDTTQTQAQRPNPFAQLKGLGRENDEY